METNIYIIIALVLLTGFILGKLLRKIGLTEVLAYLFAGIIIGPILKFNLPEEFEVFITGITLAFVGYKVGLTFSLTFLKRMGKKVLIILIIEVIVTSLIVWICVFLLTKNLALSIVLASLAPATAPAGTVAVIRDLKARGMLTNVSIAIVGLDDAAAIIIYSIGIMWTKLLLGSKSSFSVSFIHPLWEIFGAVLLGGIIGFILSYFAKKSHLGADPIFVITTATAMISWGVSKMIGVSSILTCMVLGMTVINLHRDIAIRSDRLIDNIMTPIFILFFATIGMAISFPQLADIWAIVLIYCIGRSLGKMIGCGMGGAISKSEAKITKYLGIALLNQAGVAVGLAFLAAQELSNSGFSDIIITLMATTTAVFQILSPLGTQFAIKRAGEGNQF